MPQNPFRLYQNPDGPVLGDRFRSDPGTGRPVLQGSARTGQLLPYEDWRLPARPGRRISLPV